MPDFIDVLPIPDCYREAVRQSLQRRPVCPGLEATTADVTKELLEATQAHGIDALLFASMDRSAWPEEIVEQWRHAAVVAAALEPLRLIDLRKVLALFAARDIEALVLKGTALAYSIYPEPHLRGRGDVDLLIRERDRARVDALLRAAGYQPRVTSGDELALRQSTYLGTDKRGYTHAYDVHWSIANTAVFSGALLFEELFERSVRLPRIAPGARGLCTADALLYACIHRVAHHHGSDRLIWLYDIHLLGDSLTSEERAAFWNRAAERGMIEVCRRSFEAAAQWFGDPPRTDDASRFLTAEQLARPERSARYLDRRVRRGSILLAELQALRGWRSRARRLAQLAFPPAPFMREHFGARSALTLPLFYAYRAARGFARLFRRVARR